MGNYQICDYCGNLHEKTNNKMCDRCHQNYIQIRSLVEDTPDITVLELSNRTGISVSKIHSFVKNGYFQMKEGTMEGFEGFRE